MLHTRLVPQADVTLVKAFTIQEAADRLEHLPFVPSCIVIHEITMMTLNFVQVLMSVLDIFTRFSIIMQRNTFIHYSQYLVKLEDLQLLRLDLHMQIATNVSRTRNSDL